MNRLRIVVPKGRIYEQVARLLNDTGMPIESNGRTYRPITHAEGIDIKVMKPQNIPELVQLGSHDAGFTGFDWIAETGADVQEIMDLKFDPVKIVCAIPSKLLKEDLIREKSS